MKIRSVVLAAAMMVASGGALHADEGGAPATTQSPATTQPAVKVDPTDKTAVAAANGTDIIAEGTLSKAAWSNTGKVLRAPFEGNAVAVIVFSRDRKALDDAFGGDVAASLNGAKVRVTGKVDEFRGSYEVKVSRPEQLTILEPGKATTTQPTTRRVARQQAAEPAERE